MEYSKLVAVSGMPGLYELVSSRNDGGILRSLDDNKTQFVSNRQHNFSQLESIEVYTVGNNVNLVDVFQAMERAGSSMPNAKDNDSVRKYFEKIYPEIDFERVYPSDMKKMVKWFEIIKKNDIEIKLSEPEPEPEEEEEVAVEEEEKPRKSAKSSAKPSAKESAKKEKPAKSKSSSSGKSSTRKKKGD